MPPTHVEIDKHADGNYADAFVLPCGLAPESFELCLARAARNSPRADNLGTPGARHEQRPGHTKLGIGHTKLGTLHWAGSRYDRGNIDPGILHGRHVYGAMNDRGHKDHGFGTMHHSVHRDPGHVISDPLPRARARLLHGPRHTDVGEVFISTSTAAFH